MFDDDDFGGSSSLSPQRSLRIAGAASVGSLLAVAAIFVAGGSSSHAGSASSTKGATLATGSAPALLPVVDTGTAAPASTLCTSQYTVRAGDGWFLIAKHAGVGVDQLYTLNQASAATVLQPGQVICLPAGAVVTTTATTAATTATTKKAVTTVATPTTVKHTVVTAPKATTPTTVKHSITASS